MSFFEEFREGTRIRHARGKTVEAYENHLLTHMTLNTAQVHFNKDFAASEPNKRRLVFGGATLSVVLGLASQDCAAQAIAELSLDKMRLNHPVFHGDTLYAASEILECRPFETKNAGEVLFRHWGFNQDGALVLEVERRALIRKRGGRAAEHLDAERLDAETPR